MKKSIKYGFLGALIGFFVGLLPILPIDVIDSPIETVLALPIIPVALIFGKGGHPPLAMFLSPLFYLVVGFIVGLLIGVSKK